MAMERQFKGYWWLPDQANTDISGLLKIDNKNNINLELIGSIDNALRGTRLLTQGAIDTLLGVLETGKPVTLFGCRQTKHYSSIVSNGYNVAMQNFRILWIVIGHHFSNPEEILLDSLSLELSNLDLWINHSAIRPLSVEKGTNHILKLDPVYRRVELDDVSIDVRQDVFKKSTHTKYEFEQTSQLIFRFGQPKPLLEVFRSVVPNMRNFIAFGLGIPTHITKAVGNSHSLPDIDLEIIGLRDEQKSTSTIASFETLFTLSEIMDELETKLRLWYAKASVLQPIYDLYFSLLYGASEYVDVQFLLLVQAIESYHRRAHGGNYMTKEQYSSLKDQIVKHIPQELSPEHRASLKSRIDFGYQISLATRIRKLLNDVLSPFASIFDQVINDRKLFIRKVVVTRNYLTHYDIDEGDRELLLEGAQARFSYVQSLKLILQMCFLYELGMTDTRFVNSLQRTPLFDLAVRYKAC